MTDTQATFDALRSGIAAGHLLVVLDELLHRLATAVTQGAGSEPGRFRREALLHRSTIAAIEQRRRDGTGTAADDRQIQRVTNATLELIDAVERRMKDSPIWSKPPEFPQAPVEQTLAPTMLAPTGAQLQAEEDIFVSYKREDRNQVEALVRSLRGKGWSVFWDPQILPGVANWDMLLERKLNGAKCVLVVWSARAAQSEFVRTEAHHGRNKRILLAVTIDGTVPATFALSQTTNLSGWTGADNDARIAEIHSGIAALIADQGR